MSGRARLKWDETAVAAYLAREFPQEFGDGKYRIVALTPAMIEMVLDADDRQLRPGGTISGPAIMTLMDCAAYALLIGRHGEVGRLMVTTGMSMSFLRKAGPGPLHCTIEFLKEGRTLSVVDARAWSGADPGRRLVAHGEFTYHMARES